MTLKISRVVNDSVPNRVRLQFSFEEKETKRPSPTMETLIIHSDNEGTNHASVWYDSYRHDEAGGTSTIYGHLTPEDAEQIGTALIFAARVAQGKV